MVSAYLAVHGNGLLFTAAILITGGVLVGSVIIVWRRFGENAGAILGATVGLPLLGLVVLLLMMIDLEIAFVREWPAKYELAKTLGVDLATYHNPYRFPSNYFAQQVRPGDSPEEVLAIMRYARGRYRCGEVKFQERYYF